MDFLQIIGFSNDLSGYFTVWKAWWLLQVYFNVFCFQSFHDKKFFLWIFLFFKHHCILRRLHLRLWRNFFINDFNRLLKNMRQLQHSRIIKNVIKTKNESLPNLPNTKIVPLTPSSVIPELFLFVLCIILFDLLKLFHKILINCLYLMSRL